VFVANSYTFSFLLLSGLQQLVNVAGHDWVMQSLLPQHMKIFEQAGTLYLMRITILKGHAQIGLAAKSGPLFEQIITLLLSGATDRVPNVRMTALLGLNDIARGEGVDTAVMEGQVKPVLEAAIKEEEDIDCLHACELGLEVL
jgi:hypothetical protein